MDFFFLKTELEIQFITKICWEKQNEDNKYTFLAEDSKF